jgi:uncharacterized protein (TIGR04255 family)
MKERIPTRLDKPPLLEAIFDVRFTSSVLASTVLPGILYNNLSGEKSIEKLPTLQVPEQVRAMDPNLRFAPLIRITSANFYYSISDNSIAVACKLPYPGWTKFNSEILNILNQVKESKIIVSMQRYGLKYIYIIPTDGLSDKTSLINLMLNVGSHEIKQETFLVRVEIPKGDVITVVHIISSAEALMPNGTKKQGLLIDTESITQINNKNMLEFLGYLSNSLGNVHDINKQLFFDCLKDETIQSLGPHYD